MTAGHATTYDGRNEDLGEKMRILAVLALAVGAAGALLYINYGTIEPCGILRQRIRAEASHQGAFGGFVASVTPDSVIDAVLSAQYNRPVTPALCINVLLHPESSRVVR